MRKPLTVAISGGIGSGKTVVSEIFSTMGFNVFNCDCEAKILMDNDEDIKHRISAEISPEAILPDGQINRCQLSSIVFSDKAKLNTLNCIVHGAVKRRINEWVGCNCDEPILFIETALLYQSGIDRMVDKVIEVTAPEYVRVERVMRRSSLSEREVIERINSQQIKIDSPHSDVTIIDNSGDTALIPQIQCFLNQVQTSA